MASLPMVPPPILQPPPPSDQSANEIHLKNLDPRRPPMADDKETSIIEGNDSVTGHIISTTIGGKNGEPKQTISYMAERIVGTGSFGIVFQAKCLETGETVAIKKVLQDRRYKNRELQLMRSMDHPNVISLKHCFFSTTSRDELFLNLVMEYVPETVYRVLKHYSNANHRMPLIFVKLYMYQIFRGLAYIHTVPGVCHRDVKPQNLLVDPLTHQVKLCDFGSAKVLVKGEANISYICSRYYRAPELIFGATEYTTSIDIWSAGCVLAELLLGQPLFPGESAVDQLVEIIKVLGTPTREEIRCMNPNYTEFKFPQIKAHPWHKIFHKRMPPEAIDLASRLLQYSPSLRCTAVKGEANISYICSRYYRAPELIFGATEYTTSIDIWSAGCVLAELLLGQPLFPGESAVDQLVEIIKVLGTPTREEIRCMNPNYTEFKFPQIKAHPWHKIFHKRKPPEAIDLASRLLQYSPSLRCTALEACAHPFFDELREPNARLPNGRPLTPLFNFKQELSGTSSELINKLIPEHVRRQPGFNSPVPAGT